MGGHHPIKNRRRRRKPYQTAIDWKTWLTEPIAQDDEEAWFSQPWRDGRNAVRLLESLGVLSGGDVLPKAIRRVVDKPTEELSSTDYAEVAAAGLEASTVSGVNGVIVPAASGCLCNWIANSHGGGYVPNSYLRPAVGWLLWKGLSPLQVRWEVGRIRGRDLDLGDSALVEFSRLWFQRQYANAWRVGLAPKG